MGIRERYIDILKVELADLGSDLDLLVEDYRRRKEKDEITNYVFLENLAVLKREMYGINNLVEVLDGLETEAFDDLDAMIAAIESGFQLAIREHDLADALFPLAQKKMKKVKAYFEQIPD